MVYLYGQTPGDSAINFIVYNLLKILNAIIKVLPFQLNIYQKH